MSCGKHLFSFSFPEYTVTPLVFCGKDCADEFTVVEEIRQRIDSYKRKDSITSEEPEDPDREHWVESLEIEE
jgi:hypothetical protein